MSSEIVAEKEFSTVRVAELMVKGYLTRDELAEIFNKPKKTISAMCSKGTLIADKRYPNKVYLNIAKNTRYINKKIEQISRGIEDKIPAQFKTKHKVVDGNVDNPNVEKKTVARQSTNRPKLPKLPKQQEKEVEPEVYAGNQIMVEMDQAKLRKVKAEAEAKELELAKKRGDLIDSSEVLPFINKLTKTKDKMLITEILSSLKENQIIFEYDTSFIGWFERKLTETINSVSDKVVEQFKRDIS